MFQILYKWVEALSFRISPPLSGNTMHRQFSHIRDPKIANRGIENMSDNIGFNWSSFRVGMRLSVKAKMFTYQIFFGLPTALKLKRKFFKMFVSLHTGKTVI